MPVPYVRKTKTKILKAFGKELSYREWCEQPAQEAMGLVPQHLWNRVDKLGWNPEKALTEPIRSQAPVFQQPE